MIRLLNRKDKIEFLKELKSGKRSLEDLKLDDKAILVLDANGTGEFYEPGTGLRFTQEDRLQGLKNNTWIEL